MYNPKMKNYKEKKRKIQKKISKRKEKMRMRTPLLKQF